MKAAKFILATTFALLIIQTMAEETMTVEMAVTKKLVKLKIHGAQKDSANPLNITYSGHTGKCLDIEVTSLTNANLVLTLETGRKFECDSDDTQDMMMTHSRIFALKGKSNSTQRVYAMCISPSKGSPNSSSSYKMGKMAEGYLLQLALLIERKKYQDSGGQSAVWAIIKNSDSSAVSSNDPVQRRALRRYIAFAKQGLAINDLMLFENDDYGPFIDTQEYYITGEIKWEMQKKGNATLTVFNEQGNYVTTIFSEKNYDTGNQSYNFKVTSCLIKPDQKYLVRLKIKDTTVEELACTGK